MGFNLLNARRGVEPQSSALGMNSLHVGPVGSPTMNRMEGGGEQGVERNTGAAGNSPTGTAMQGNIQAAVGTGTAATQAAPGLVGPAGSLVGFGHMLPPAMSTFGSYGPMRGGLMDPRNYGLNQGFLGCQGHGCSGCTASRVSRSGCAWTRSVRTRSVRTVKCEVRNQDRGVHVMECQEDKVRTRSNWGHAWDKTLAE